METNIQKWGNSLGLRLPQALAQKKSLTAGSTVLLTETESGVLIEVVSKKKPTLQSLIKKITPQNQHAEVDFDPVVGNEVW